ncbi:MAG: toll/interleukin-1 receptor domain-containing protein, partial [Candidatus Hermodarchaeota archaeon]
MSTFICHARVDEEIALSLRNKLVENDIKVWIDQVNIPPGANWQECIESAIKNCSYMIVLLSESSVKSSEVEDEWNLARKHGKTIIPILISQVDIPYRLQLYQNVNLEKGMGQTIARLMEVIPKTLSQKHMVVDRFDYAEHEDYAAFIFIDKNQIVLMNPNAYSSFSALTDALFINYLSEFVASYSYGAEWVLVGEAAYDGTEFWFGRELIVPLEWIKHPGESITDLNPNWSSSFLPNQLGIIPKTTWGILTKKKYPEMFEKGLLGIVTNHIERITFRDSFIKLIMSHSPNF